MLLKICLGLSSLLIVSANLIDDLEPKSDVDSKIVGGYLIDIKEAPWQAALLSLGFQNCGASIIGERWLLTAGHCAAEGSDPRVRVGSSRWAFGGTTYKVKRTIQHPKFSLKKIDYDFLLLELERNITFSDQVQPVALPSSKQELADGTTCFVTGWGSLSTKWPFPALKLRGVKVPVVNQTECLYAYWNIREISPRMLCAGFIDKGGKDACQGDSGGPLITFEGEKKKPTLTGVVSWGGGCGEKGYPGVYARVQSVREWISKTTGI